MDIQYQWIKPLQIFHSDFQGIILASSAYTISGEAYGNGGGWECRTVFLEWGILWETLFCGT